MTAAALRRQIRARQGWQTRRRERIADLERQRRRLRRPDRIREVDREIRELERQIRRGDRELRDLRRQLAAARRAEEPAPEPEPEPEPAPEPEPEPEPEPAPEPGAVDPYEDRILAAGGGVTDLTTGPRHGLVWVPEPPLTTTDPNGGQWIDRSPDGWTTELEELLRQLAPHPEVWRARLRVQISWHDPEGGVGRPSGGDGDAYETSDYASPPAGMPAPPSGGIETGFARRRTLTGWVRTTGRLAEVCDLVCERLGDADWLVEGLVIEILYSPTGAPLPAPLPRGEVTDR